MLKEPFTVIYTGLKRLIGSPQDFRKNKDSNNFPTNFDLSVPINETAERRVHGGS
jgi:hypothetical protein